MVERPPWVILSQARLSAPPAPRRGRGSGESRESTFVQREEGCGKTLGMRASRLATTVKLPLALLSWSGAQERAEPWQAEVAPTRPRTWRSFSR